MDKFLVGLQIGLFGLAATAAGWHLYDGNTAAGLWAIATALIAVNLVVRKLIR